VWLRRTKGFRVAVLVGLVGTLALAVFVAAFAPERSAGPTAVGFWLVVLVPAFLLVLRPKYRIRDDVLTMHGLRRRTCRLPDVVRTGFVREKSVRGPTSLLLVIDRRIRIRLADGLWCQCYYRPEDLRALADGLAKSPHEQPRRDAGWLRWFADDPGSHRWPS
jgi:hypothetical protein